MDTRRRIEATLKHKQLEDDERTVLRRLMACGYAENGTPVGILGVISADELAREVAWHATISNNPDTQKERAKRHLRKVINRLIIVHGIPIMCQSGPGGGYYLPAFDQEVEENYARFHRRAMTGLMKASRARRAAYADAVIQLAMGFDGPEGEEIRQRIGAPRIDRLQPPAWVQVVTKLLDQMKGNPEAYATQIATLQERYGDIFVPRHKVAELRGELAKVQRMIDEISMCDESAAAAGGSNG